MPGKVDRPDNLDITPPPSQSGESNPSGRWKHKDVSTTEPQKSALLPRNTESDTDSGIDSPLSGRSISPVSGSDTFLKSQDTFSFDEAAIDAEIEAAILNGGTRLAPGRMSAGGNASIYKASVEDESGTEHFLVLKAPNTMASFDRENDALTSISRHPNIVKYYSEIDLAGQADQKGLLLEYLPGSSLEKLYSELLSTPMPAEERMNAIKYLELQKFEAAAHIGQSGIVHSDQKPSNYLCNPKTGIVKLIDFGEAVREGDKCQTGHEDYAAPETLRTIGSRALGPEARTSMDSYALGQMLYRQIMAKEGELGLPYLFGVDPSGSQQDSQRQFRILQGGLAMQALKESDKAGKDVKALDTSPESIKDRAFQMAKNCLLRPEKESAVIVFAKEPEEANGEVAPLAANDKTGQITSRNEVQTEVSEEEIQAAARKIEPEILQASTLINGLMHINPDKRMSATDALKHPWFQQNPADREKAIQTLSKLDL